MAVVAGEVRLFRVCPFVNGNLAFDEAGERAEAAVVALGLVLFLLLSLVPLLAGKRAAALLVVGTLPFHISWLFLNCNDSVPVCLRLQWTFRHAAAIVR